MAEKRAASADSEKKAAEFSDFEKAAMKERAAELRAQKKGADALAGLMAKIDELQDADKAFALRMHEVIMEAAPQLQPRTWYGMPAYAQDGKVVCFVQPRGKFESRYHTLGFNDSAQLDDGAMWPSAYAIQQLTPEAEAQAAILVKRATGLI